MQVDAIHRMSVRFLALAVQHYLRFNVHDVARVFRAMVRTNVASLTSAEDIFVLWKHEIQRGVLDKLPTLDDYTAAWEVRLAHSCAWSATCRVFHDEQAPPLRCGRTICTFPLPLHLHLHMHMNDLSNWFVLVYVHTYMYLWPNRIAWQQSCLATLREKVPVHLPSHIYEVGQLIFMDAYIPEDNTNEKMYRQVSAEEASLLAEECTSQASMEGIVLLEDAVVQVCKA